MPTQNEIFEAKWVSVNDELPGLPPKACKGVMVRIYAVCGSGRLNCDAVYTYYGRFIVGHNDVTDNVTHWMDIPKPPIEYAYARSNL